MRKRQMKQEHRATSAQTGLLAQGDLLFRPLKAWPATAGPALPPDAQGRFVLAFGEATGHAHVLDGCDVTVADDTVMPTRRYLRLVKPARVLHEEHDLQTLSPGLYEIIRQRTWDFGRSRQVAD